MCIYFIIMIYVLVGLLLFWDKCILIYQSSGILRGSNAVIFQKAIGTHCLYREEGNCPGFLQYMGNETHLFPSASYPLSFTASLAKQFLCQSWVKPSGDREKGSQFNSALHTVLW